MKIICPSCGSNESRIEGIKDGEYVSIDEPKRIVKYKRLLVRHKLCPKPLSNDTETRFTVIVDVEKL